MYCAVSNSLGNIAGGIGVILGGWIIELLKDWHMQVAGWTFGAFQVTFVVSSILRFLAAGLLIRRMPERTALTAARC